ncbi:MAG: MgtC/SapB family protein [Actinomycetota bacterium]
MESFPHLSTGELVLRVLAAAFLGGLVGFEREFSDQAAGFRTHILVSLGAALFTLVGAYGAAEFFSDEGAPLRLDPTRVAAQVVTGIGFLGAGAILRQGVNVKGLTTAAALWVTAAIGTAAGLGYWEGAVAVTIVTVASLYGLKRLERAVFPRLKRGFFRFHIEMGPELSLAQLAESLEDAGVRVHTMKFVTDEEGERHLVAYLAVGSNPPEAVAERVAGIPGVDGIDWN